MVVLQVYVNYEFMIEVGPLMLENRVKKSQFHVTSPLLPRLKGWGVIALEWDESQVMCQGEEQASEHVPKPRPDVVQVGPDPNECRLLRSPGQVERSDGEQIKVITSDVKRK